MAFLSVCNRFNRKFATRWTGLPSLNQKYSNYSQQAIAEPSTDDTPKRVEYPPILDLSKGAIAEREKLKWHNEVKKLNTIEEKILKMNMPYYYGLRTIPLQNDEYHYNCLPYFQHWTRTQYEDGIPETWFNQSAEDVDRLVAAVREQIIEAIAFQYNNYW